MKTIGLLGGMSWQSTVSYYQIINQTIEEALGGLHSAKILLYSVDFAEIEACQVTGDWDKSARILSAGAQTLAQAGADFVALCTNTMHKVAPQISSSIDVPFIHIAQATAEAIQAQNIEQIALLGTSYTMTQDFYKQILIEAGIGVCVPEGDDIGVINDIIFKELCLGKVTPQAKNRFINIIDTLNRQGAQGVILGCTEIGLLIKQSDTTLPLFDTTDIHAKQIARLALG